MIISKIKTKNTLNVKSVIMANKVYTLEDLLEARLIINAMNLFTLNTGISSDVLNSSEFTIEDGKKVKAILRYATKPAKAIERYIYTDIDR